MPPEAHQRRRARQACTHCNARRVKCNVSEKLPCDNCIAAGTECQLRVSRRGKHPRHRPGQPPKQQSQSEPKSHSKVQSQTHIPPPPLPPSQRHRQYQHQQLPLGAPPLPHANDALTNSTSSVSPDEPPSLLAKSAQTSPNDENEELSQASHALASLRSGGDARPNPKPREDSEYVASIYFGESSSVRYIGLENFAFSVSQFNSLQNGTGRDQSQAEASKGQARSAPESSLVLPAHHVTTALLKAYFQWFHPFCPIVDEDEVWHQFETGTVSTLLLQCLLLIAAAHCDDSVLADGHLGERTAAKATFLSRARDLYDADVEQNSLVVMQSLLLMSLWRPPVSQEKDPRYWIGSAIHIAMRRGLHCSRTQEKATPNAHIPERAKKLARRVWWFIYMHERHGSATLGMPQRIRDEDCDVEPLEPDDFSLAFSTSRTKDEITDCIDYSMGMVSLAGLLGNVLTCEYSPGRPPTEAARATVRDDLDRWKQTLPPTMRIDEEFSSQPSLHSGMLQMNYNSVVILLYRNCMIDFTFDQQGQHAVQAGARMTRLIEDMLPRGILRHAQFHVISSVTGALCIIVMELRTAKGAARITAEHRVKVCLLALQEIQQAWEFRSWITQLFLRRNRAAAANATERQQESKNAATPSDTPLQASYGAPASGDNTGFLTNLTDLADFGFTFENGIAQMMEWPTEDLERNLFGQIYDSNPFW